MKRFTGSVVGMLVLNAAFSSALAADWYAKDNLQPGHDPSMIRLDDGYALMSTNNHLQLWTSEDAYTWKDNGRTMQAVPSWLTQYAPGMEDVWAPDIYKFDDEYRVYYCGSEFDKRNSAIGYTASKSMIPGTAGLTRVMCSTPRKVLISITQSMPILSRLARVSTGWLSVLLAWAFS